jgi:hypothetical protein
VKLRGRFARKLARRRGSDRVLVAGWFSWPGGSATAGDLMARDVACEWLDGAGREYDVANAPQFGTGVDWREVDPKRYSDLVFVCGPVGPLYTALGQLLQRFPGSRHVGLDLTMIAPLSEWNPFDVLIERDSTRATNPDLALVAAEPRVPVIGVVLVEPYTAEFPGRDRQDAARNAAELLLQSVPAARVPIDTRLDVSKTQLRSPGEVESLIARMDAVVTTRLHGLVLAIKRGVPALAIDPVSGGSKIKHQADVLGWPAVRIADRLSQDDLRATLEFCMSEEARRLARHCAEQGAKRLESVRDEFVATLTKPSGDSSP